jgi:hypothetical protein
MSALMPAVDLDARSRAAVWRSIRQEAATQAEAVHAGGVMAEARQTLRRQDRVHRAIDRLQPFVSRLESHLREELRDAQVRGDNNRRILLEGEIDSLFCEFDEMVRGLAGDFE